MNKELIKIIESLCHRVEYTSSSGIVFIESKPELCRIIRLRENPKCSGVQCDNCLFVRNWSTKNLYSLHLEKVIQTF